MSLLRPHGQSTEWAVRVRGRQDAGCLSLLFPRHAPVGETSSESCRFCPASERRRFPDPARFLFAHQTEISRDNLQKLIAQWENTTNIDRGQFEKCVSGSLTSGQIEQDVALGNELGVQATPTVFHNGETVDGPSAEELSALIRRAAPGR